jgi:hypothetical protein
LLPKYNIFLRAVDSKAVGWATHHWRRPQVISDTIRHSVRRDFERLLLPLHDQGVELADGKHPVEIPIVQYVAHGDHIYLREWIFEEITWLKAQALGNAAFLCIFFEDGSYLLQVETDALQMSVVGCNLHGEIALRCADVGKAAVWMLQNAYVFTAS